MASRSPVREHREKHSVLSLIAGIVLLGSGLARAQVVINEVMASNVESYADPQGEYDDWIELYNAGDVSVNLCGMYLTDDKDEPTKWQIPAASGKSTPLGAGRYLVIWMDGDTDDFVPVEPSGTRTSDLPASGFHAGFRLDAGGDKVHLFDADGVTRIDSLVFDEQTPDVSYGRYPDGGDTLRFFGEPTPGAANNEGYLGQVAPLRFSHERGFYSAAVTRDGREPGFYLTMTTATPDAEIVYTLGGVAPDDDSTSYRVPPGIVYTGPIRVVSTTCVRAMARKAGWKSTKIYTQTFLFDIRDSVKSLPIVSLVGDAKKTFYEPDGVMAIVGGTRTSDGVWTSSGAGSYNNILNRELERPVSVEWFVAGEDDAFQVDCGLRVHGSDYTRPRYIRQSGYWSDYRGKIGLRLYFRSEYGQRRLEYPLFPLSEAEQFATVILRAGHNDPFNPFIRDELVRRLHRDMGQVACMGAFANLFINGEHKGYYNPTEQVTEESCQEWFDSDESWDVMTMNGIRDGDTESWNAMLRYAQNNNLADPAAYAGMCEKLDVVCFIDYLIARLWPNDWDWPQNNWSAACERSATGKWKFFVWDAEGTFESGQLYDSRFGELNSQGNPNANLYRALKANASFRLLFADRLYQHFFNGGALTRENVTWRFSQMQEELDGVIPSLNTYIIDTWTPNRHAIFLNACAGEGVYTFAGPSFAVGGVSKYGAYLDIGESVEIVSPVTGLPVYYTLDGNDPVPSISTYSQTSLSTTLVAADAPKRVLVPTDASDGNWQSLRAKDSNWLLCSGAPGGVGYERGSGYEDSISLDVGSLMYNLNGSCYIRIPFQFSGSSSGFETLTLRMQYDDGFVAYLNGEEVARRNFEGEPAWNSIASAGHDDTAAETFEAIDVSAYLSKLRQGDNILAIHGLNAGIGSSDFLIGATLTAGQAAVVEDTVGQHEYSSPLTLTMSTRIKARAKNGATWSALADAVFAVGPVRESLRISEIMFHPCDSDDPHCEYIELTNVGGRTINLNLARFTQGIHFTFSDMELPPGAFCLVVKDREAFEARYGSGLPIAGQYTGTLAGAGERIELCDALAAVIHSFKYRDDWFRLADGRGFSLTVIDPSRTAPDLWGNAVAWRLSAAPGGSPGRDDSADVPAPGAIVINELLANSSGVGPDWIELHNTTDEPVNIGGWFLSDDGDDLTRYRIADGTVLPARGFLLFDEDDHFGNPNDPGCRRPFGLSAGGETVYLHSGDSSGITGYEDRGRFGASEPGVTFGRYATDATVASLVLLTESTPGRANADPTVGPVVISEILYHSSNSSDVEFVELLNISDANVTLYDPSRGTPWRFTDDPENPAIDLLFPADPPVTLAPGEYLLLVKDVQIFKSQFSSSADVRILSWGMGKLGNAGETIQLSRPGERDSDGVRTWIPVDRIRYSDGSHPEDFPAGVDLWPAQADGQGLSLTRMVPGQYGDNPLNWRALTPSPGTARPPGIR
ncbi:MAG TPA: lamin tail domain-containing protein [Sedimentisphaerales bacterium]|nr:lamin tail domain-containing protein [Sedimentisphaerales bacterium]HNU28635.1 lamin tail domain-containing protein [Sedimentisphaerales bacterium]